MIGVALDANPRYFGTHLSENIAETPEGYLICRNAVIGRSGFQTYLVKELTDPDGLLEGHGPHDEIQVWRDPSEVFSAQTVSSFESKTFTVSHPDQLLDPETDREHHAGHAQNVRKGDEILDDGNWPLLADIIAKDKEAIDAIHNGERQLSCGYSYRLAKNGERFEQRNIIGNHIALVPKGRAGADARINDAAPQKEPLMPSELLKKIFGFGLKEYAKDAKPEDVTAAVEALNLTERPAASAVVSGPVFRKIGETSDGIGVFRQFANDAEAEEAEKKEKEGKDRKPGKDAEMCPTCKKSMDACTCGKDSKGNDAADHRKKMHDALDKMLDVKGDADLEEMKTQLGNMFVEEENKPGHAAASDEMEGEDNEVAPISLSDEEKKEEEKKAAEDKAAKDAEAEAEKKKKEEEGKDANSGSDIVRPEPELAASDLPQAQFDTGALVLRALKPIIAKSGDKKMIAAFDTICRSRNAMLKKSVIPGNGYDLFGAASRRSTVGDAATNGTIAEECEKLDAMYKKVREERSKSVKK